MFTWRELELEVCGRPRLDIDLLQKNTTYTGCTATDPHVVLFWQMMRTRLSDVEHGKFLVFVWGRSRYYNSGERIEMPMKILRHEDSENADNIDQFLPISHTCFFQLELPRYSSLDIMHQKILYAITHCTAVDGDNHLNQAPANVVRDFSTILM